MRLAPFVALLLVAGPAAAAKPPAGSYQKSCSVIVVSGSDLTAMCKDESGEAHFSTLSNYGDCTGEIGNYDGTLRCNKGGGTPPKGSYTKTCKYVWINNTTLHATCKTLAGTWRMSKLENVGTCYSDPYNADGQLTCDRTGNLPKGSYKLTCKDARFENGTLTASCESWGKDPLWFESSLSDLDGCYSEVYQRAGKLTCDRGKWPVPEGTYKQTCRDLVMLSETKLEASCFSSNSGWTTSTLVIGDCPEIVNSGGKLACKRPKDSSGGSTSTSTTPKWVCCTDIPSGNVTINTEWSPTSCGNPSSSTQNRCQVQLPSGTRMEVCGGSYVPSGWQITGYEWQPNRCGNPSSNQNNVMVIEKQASKRSTKPRRRSPRRK